jgi:hypothetical protein
MTKHAKLCLLISALASSQLAMAGDFMLHAGAYKGHSGKKQHVEDFLGVVDASVTDRGNINWLAGLGYFMTASKNEYARFDLGLDAYYLAPTKVKGVMNVNIPLLGTFSDKYEYKSQHVPIYAAAKAIIHTGAPSVSFVFNAGAGVNLFRAYGADLKGMQDDLDKVFANKTKATFSASAGLGLRINSSRTPLECGYRFFYLGEGKLKTADWLELDDPKTGKTYAHAGLCSVSF